MCEHFLTLEFLIGVDWRKFLFETNISNSSDNLILQNLYIALSRVFISFEAFRLTLIKKDRQNGEHRKGRVFVEGASVNNQIKLCFCQPVVKFIPVTFEIQEINYTWKLDKI